MPHADPPHPDYPSRSNRTHRIAELRPEVNCVVTGRVSSDGTSTYLTDETGTVRLQIAESVPTGALIEAHGKWTEQVFACDEVHVLVPANTEGRARNKRRSVIRFRAKTLREIRAFFDDRDFIEVETPLLIRSPGMEPHLRAFETQTETGEKRYLPTSPEYAMKRLLTEGHERIYQICKSFRDEAPAPLHNPEFTMLEWYRAYSDYRKIATDTESLVSTLAENITGSTKLTYRRTDIDVAPPWQRLSIREAFAQYADISADPCGDESAFLTAARKSTITSIDDEDTFETAFFKLFLDQIEPKLGSPRPTILTDYPASMSALAKRSHTAPEIAERFEVYIAGIELANAFTELNDPAEQRSRLEQESEERASLGARHYEMDEAFLSALESGMPPSGGIALGVDRLIMLLANANHITDVIAFPA